MATYDFRCDDRLCGEIFETSMPMADLGRTHPVCPACGGTRTTKLILETPHVRLNWKAYDRNETGSSRLVIRAGRSGRPSAIDDFADVAEHKKVAREFRASGP